MKANLKNVNTEEVKEVEETVTETEGTATAPEKDDKPQPPAVTEEPKKDGIFKKIGKGIGKVGSGIKNALDKDVKLWQVIAAPVVIAGVVIGAKRIYEKGQRDALGLPPDEDDFQLPEEDIKALETTADEEVIDVEDYEEESEVDEVTEEIEDEEVYEDEEFIEE